MVFPSDPPQRAPSPPRPSWPIQPPPGEYAIAALDRAKQSLAREWFVAVLRERSNALAPAAESDPSGD
jgi:hypothetical protein